MVIKMVKYNCKCEEVVMGKIFHSELETVFLLSNFYLQFDRIFDAILQKIKDFIKLGSSRSALRAKRLELHIASYLPIFA